MRVLILSAITMVCAAAARAEDMIDPAEVDKSTREILKELGQPFRGPATITGDVKDICVGGTCFSNIDFGKSKDDVLTFALKAFRMDNPSKMTPDEEKTQKERQLVYVAYDGELRRLGKEGKVTLAPKTAGFFLRFQTGRMQHGLNQTVNVAGGIAGSRAKVVKNAKFRDVPQSAFDELAKIKDEEDLDPNAKTAGFVTGIDRARKSGVGRTANTTPTRTETPGETNTDTPTDTPSSPAATN